MWCFNGAVHFQDGRHLDFVINDPSNPGFNGAVHFQDGRRHQPELRYLAGWELQWGRPFSGRKTLPVDDRSIKQSWLQWGRPFSGRKTSTSGSDGFNIRWASMGPSIFRTEDGLIADRTTQIAFASMGPSIFRTEDPVMKLLGEYWFKLQWGRPFSGRKTTNRPPCQPLPIPASMGPSIFRTEDDKAKSEAVTAEAASMGPSIFRTEDSTPAKQPAPSTVRLQWGRPFSGRKTVLKLAFIKHAIKLQWGRPFSGRKTGGVTGFCAATQCFNGAVHFQDGRHPPLPEPGSAVKMLQWGRPFSGRKTSVIPNSSSLL